MLLYNRDQVWHDMPHWLPHHLFDNRGHRKQCRFPPRDPWISLPGLRGGGLWGVAGLYQPIQTQLTSRPTILFAACICWVRDLSLKAGQMLNFLITPVKPRAHPEGAQICCIFCMCMLPPYVLSKESMIWWAHVNLLSREIQQGHICIVILVKYIPSISFAKNNQYF